MMVNYILYILLAPSHRLNKCQNLATSHQKKKLQPTKQGLKPIIFTHLEGGWLVSLKGGMNFLKA